MSRKFNVAGPCDPARHYMIPPLRRLPGILALVEDQSYFVLHAPRQVGKSTALYALAQELTSQGKDAAVLLSMETGEPFPERIGTAEQAILGTWQRKAMHWLPPELRPPPWPAAQEGGQIGAALAAWSRSIPRPLVVFLDEIDALRDETLRSILRQLREGYPERPRDFPWSLCLCGLRDVRDYKIASGGSSYLGTASPFNIKVESLTMRNFTEEEVAELYQQHTEETGQMFTPAAVARAFYLSQGQPWLVNALADQATRVLCSDPQRVITAEHIEEAKELLIQRRDTHIDSLAERLREPRVRAVIEPILVGTTLPPDIMNDDLLYCRDLGLIVDQPQVRIANPIYAELIPRSLTYVMQATIPLETAWYLRPDGPLDMPALLRAFQAFYAEHSESWLERYDYKEVGPHLILMAFLQRVINGGGRIAREFAIGSGRTDLVVQYQGRRDALELKLRRSDKTQTQGVEQLCRYLDHLGEKEGYLVLFDRRKKQSWKKKIFQQDVHGPSGKVVHVYGA